MLHLTEIGDGGGGGDFGSVPAETRRDGVSASRLGSLGALDAADGRQLDGLPGQVVDLCSVRRHVAVGVAIRRGRRALERRLGAFDQHLFDTVFAKVQLVGGDVRAAALDFLFERHPRVEVGFETVGFLWTPFLS